MSMPSCLLLLLFLLFALVVVVDKEEDYTTQEGVWNGKFMFSTTTRTLHTNNIWGNSSLCPLFLHEVFVCRVPVPEESIDFPCSQDWRDIQCCKIVHHAGTNCDSHKTGPTQMFQNLVCHTKGFWLIASSIANTLPTVCLYW